MDTWTVMEETYNWNPLTQHNLFLKEFFFNFGEIVDRVLQDVLPIELIICYNFDSS